MEYLKKERLKKWFKNPYNLTFTILLVLIFILYLHYFSLTRQQPLWWDEAEYMLKAKSIALGTPDTGYWSGRPFLFSYLASILFFLGLGEASIKFLIMLFSIANFAMLYFLGKDLLNKRAALMATFLMSVFYLYVFYSMRILVNVLELSLGLFLFLIFYSGYFKRKKENYLLLLFPMTIIGFGLRFTAVLYLAIIILFLILIKGKDAFKISKLNYSFLIAFAIGIVGLFILLLKGINPISSFLKAFSGTTFVRGFHTVIPVTTSYLKLILNSLGLPLFFCFLIGLSIFLKLFILLDKILFKKSSNYAPYLFIFLWLAVAIIFYGSVIDLFDDRYFMMAFPAIFLICGKGLDIIYNYLKKFSKPLAIILILFILLFSGYSLLKHSDNLIKIKLHSYDSVKEAGLWIKENSNPEDIIITTSTPQNTYYSERQSFPYPDNESDFPQFLEQKKPKYLVLSIWERSPDWVYNWFQNNSNVEVVKAFTSHGIPNQATLVIYRLKS